MDSWANEKTQWSLLMRDPFNKRMVTAAVVLAVNFHPALQKGECGKKQIQDNSHRLFARILGQ